MPRIDVHSFYADSLRRHGDTAEGLHFQSVKTQLDRFRVLRECLPEQLSELTLVDVGCGFGDLLRYLEEHGEAPGRYICIDMHERMVATARGRTGAEEPEGRDEAGERAAPHSLLPEPRSRR